MPLGPPLSSKEMLLVPTGPVKTLMSVSKSCIDEAFEILRLTQLLSEKIKQASQRETVPITREADQEAYKDKKDEFVGQTMEIADAISGAQEIYKDELKEGSWDLAYVSYKQLS